MNLECVWSEEKHNEFLKYLKTLADLEYKKFNSRIINDNSVEYIGVRTPALRKISKIIARNDYEGFIKYNAHKYYEEKAIHGFIIGYAKLEYDELIKHLKEFIPHISSWALTDMTSTKFKQILKNKDVAFDVISNFTKSKNQWEVRLGLIMFLNMYIEEKYINKILSICKSINSKHPCSVNGEIPYYVKIGNAWLICECYVKFPAETEKLLKNKVLDKWTQNKAIQKIKESFRVDSVEKQRLENYKIKK